MSLSLSLLPLTLLLSLPLPLSYSLPHREQIRSNEFKDRSIEESRHFDVNNAFRTRCCVPRSKGTDLFVTLIIYILIMMVFCSYSLFFSDAQPRLAYCFGEIMETHTNIYTNSTDGVFMATNDEQ